MTCKPKNPPLTDAEIERHLDNAIARSSGTIILIDYSTAELRRACELAGLDPDVVLGARRSARLSGVVQNHVIDLVVAAWAARRRLQAHGQWLKDLLGARHPAVAYRGECRSAGLAPDPVLLGAFHQVFRRIQGEEV